MMKCLLSLVLLGCFSVIQGQWVPPPLPVADPACPAPNCNLPSNLDVLFPMSDPRFFWQCGGNGAGMELFVLECPPFQFFSFANQRCDFIDQFLPTCSVVSTIVPPVTTPTTPTTPITTPTTPVTPITPETTPITTPTTPLTTSQAVTTPPPNNNCPCQCHPCMPWFPCNPCQASCACSG
ncbi:unnamed protein product [Diamesa tonsa]